MYNPPIRYWHESEKQFNRSEIKNLVLKYGSNILIGGDPGHGSEFTEAMIAVDEFNAKKHVYLVGPGMLDWSDEEANQIKMHAKSVGIDTNKSSWHEDWLNYGFIEKNKREFKYYDSQQFCSAEIDNLDQIVGQDPLKTIKFYTSLESFLYNSGCRIRLMMKNLNEEQITACIKAVDNGSISVDFFAPYAMMEKGSGNPESQIKYCELLGIKAVTPINGLRDTYHYGTIREGIPYIQENLA